MRHRTLWRCGPPVTAVYHAGNVGVRHRTLWRCGPPVTAVYHAGNAVGLGAIAGYVVVNVMSLSCCGPPVTADFCRTLGARPCTEYSVA